MMEEKNNIQEKSNLFAVITAFASCSFFFLEFRQKLQQLINAFR